MTNKEIAKKLKLTASLLEIHDENQFKIRTYTNAVIHLENQQEQLHGKSIEYLETLDGIGKGLAKAIVTINETGTFDLLDELKAKTPEGVIHMIGLKGIGPKKIRAIWKDLGIENADQLYEACLDGKIAKLKGFGLKTQESIKENLEYLHAQKGMAHYANAEPFAELLLNLIRSQHPNIRCEFTGEMRRRTETVGCVDIIAGTKNKRGVQSTIEEATALALLPAASGPYSLRGIFTGTDLNWLIRFVDPVQFESKLMIFTGSGNHLARVADDKSSLYQFLLENQETTELKAYNAFGLPYLEPELREGDFELKFKSDSTTPNLLNLADIRGPFHNHSNYSDGRNTIRELAEYCMSKGYEYLGLSDHSKSAFYANGLREFDVIRQHKEIDALNVALAPFKIFKGIESDILNDGSLDYDNDVLASFDFIVASVHSNLNMDMDKATARLLKAIENPYTTILGHPTGRLLLRRPGYPIDYKKVIDSCARNNVIIEINANPWRLDLDWRWVHYALEQGVLLSINPDAHETEGFDDMKYGVYMGRKGGLTKEMTFNTWELGKVEKYLKDRKTNISK